MTEEPVKVYNFEVEDFHTYHVCTLGVLVHNAGKNYASLEPDKYTELTQSEVKDILKELGLEGIFDGCIYDRLTDAEMAVGSIYHKTAIKNDENGTEAAAVTMMLMEAMALLPEDDIVEMNMDCLLYTSDAADD